MNKTKIILISLLLIITITSLSTVVATDTEEININNTINSVDNNNLITTDNYNLNKNTNENTDENTNLNENSIDYTNTLNDNQNNSEQINLIEEKSIKNNLKSNSLSSTITVDGSALNQMSNPTIQNAINSASAGDTIIITGKNYVHCHFIVDKQLTIISEVGTTMSPCPSNTQGSGSHGIFYINSDASGTIIKGFNFTNTYGANDDYGVLVRGVDNVEIINCTINTVSDGDGIRIESSNNTAVKDSLIQNSNNGIKIINSENILVYENLIKDSTIGVTIVNSTKSTVSYNNINNNQITGLYIAEGNYNTTIEKNNITYNQQSGINISSGNYIYILSNFIGYNMNNRSSSGAGIYVNCNITKIEIKGNFIKQNGQYGVLNDYRVRNMDAKRGAENLEIINNNYFLGHTERLAYHIEYTKYDGGPFNYDEETDTYIYVGSGNGTWDIGKTVVYLAYAFFRDETICGATLFKAPSTTWGNDVYKLDLSEITQEKAGIYSVSIVDKNGNIAKDLNSIYVIFYLNKNNTYAEPQEGDIYKIVLMENGTATVDFTDCEFKESGNKITAAFPGLFDIYTVNPYVEFDVNDEDIPGSFRQTTINASSTSLVPKSGDYIYATLIDENGNPLANQTINFKISGISNTYTKTTDENGSAKLKISLSSAKTYEITISYNGSENYNKSSKTINLTIKKQTPKIISSNVDLIPKSGEYYTVNLTDENNKGIANKNISFTIGKSTYIKTTDENGITKLKINLANEGKYTITIKSEKTNQYNAVSKTNTITIKTGANKVNINSENKTYPPKSGEYYTVSLTDKDNNPLSNKQITFSISGNTYTKTTDDEGIAKLKINLKGEKTYPITIKYAGDDIYSSAIVKNTITIKKLSPILTTYNRTFIAQSGQYFTAKLTDNKNNPIKDENISFTIGKTTYTKTTDDEGIAKLKINLKSVKTNQIITKFLGNNQYKTISKTNTITITNETEKSYIDNNLPNSEIQRILDDSKENFKVEFLGNTYDNISLTVNKTLLISSQINTTLNSKESSPAFIVNGDSIEISDLIINVDNIKNIYNTNNINSSVNSDENARNSIINETFTSNYNNNEGYGIIINNSNKAVIENNIITNTLNQSKIDDYNNGSTVLPGNGIYIINSTETIISQNEISNFESGIYSEYSNKTEYNGNIISKNNYGIKYGFGNTNTEIINNTIIDNIGWYTEEVPEGPRGYGIFLNNSASNIIINNNNISNNYMGISIDSNNSTGIVIIHNLIADNALEGIRFNEGYDLAENAVEPNITNNAIYRNAKGPSLMILGEMSANPNGIYGPGQWNDSLKLKIDPNWYGVNNLRTWDNDTGIVGVGTMCPRIKTTTISFNTLELVENGTYIIKLYKDGELATDIASFDLYATLNKNSNKKTEVHFWVENGIGTFTFDKENYLESNNTIEISVGSLINIVDRIYTSFFIYDVPESEIPV